MDKNKIKKIISPLFKLKYGIRSKGWVYIGKGTKIVNAKHVHMSEATQVAAYCLICPHSNAHIYFGKNVTIGMFSRVACINEISLGNDIITGPNVFISDYNHKYEEIDKPISKQGNTGYGNKVHIGDGSWIGTNVVICGNVNIGKHVVIGAGSFVNRDIPDYCVAVGNPARVIKKYNFDTKKWERVNA